MSLCKTWHWGQPISESSYNLGTGANLYLSKCKTLHWCQRMSLCKSCHLCQPYLRLCKTRHCCQHLGLSKSGTGANLWVLCKTRHWCQHLGLCKSGTGANLWVLCKTLHWCQHLGLCKSGTGANLWVLSKTRHWCQTIPQLVSRLAAVPDDISVGIKWHRCETRYRYQRYAIATVWAGSDRMWIFCWKWTAMQAPFILFLVSILPSEWETTCGVYTKKQQMSRSPS